VPAPESQEGQPQDAGAQKKDRGGDGGVDGCIRFRRTSACIAPLAQTKFFSYYKISAIVVIYSQSYGNVRIKVTGKLIIPLHISYKG